MNKLEKILNRKTGIVDIAYFIVGAIVYALSMNVFILPHRIVPGGVSGIASILQNTVGWDAGIMYFVLNVPLFIAAFACFGFKFVSKTFIAMTLVSVFTELIAKVFPKLQYFPTNNEPAIGLIAAICAGVTSGIGLAIIFLRGATTGGSEIAAKLMRIKFPGVSFGRMMFLVDIVIIAAGYVVFKYNGVTHAENSAIFSLIVVYLTSAVIDTVLDGNSVARVALIVSGNTDEIKKNLMNGLQRGVTVLRGSGGYTNNVANVIMCALRRQQVQECRKIVKECDDKAFVIILHATEVLGQGFDDVNKDPL
ncbi:MAG: YitT family protein [Clostridia bacterium]|nr:YitT family protein [Clostridia bacterium]MBR4439453.1 YitT family protein [Clostridia bacterium]MBR5769314.1 YitT family protein [Clostridia bacterium]MBR5942443.1 YitT family protein [Clostridia bacterium]